MKINYIHSTKYKIKPRLKTHWFRENKTVFDLFAIIVGEEWVYNGLDSDLIPYEKEVKIATFNDLISAKKFKKSLRKSK